MTTKNDEFALLNPAMSRRNFLLASAVAALSAGTLLEACGSSGSSNGNLTIEYLAINQLNTSWPAILNSITSQYAKTHAGISFKLDYVPQQNLLQKLQLLAGQGALPILYNTPDVATMAQLQKDGEALDIESTFQQLGVIDELAPAAVTLVKQVYGSLDALPFELNIEGFWYNKQFFAQNNVQPPQTWDELVQIAGVFQQKGIQPFSASGIQGWPITRLISGYLFRTIGPEAMTAIQSGQAKLTDPTYVAAAQAVASLLIST